MVKSIFYANDDGWELDIEKTLLERVISDYQKSENFGIDLEVIDGGLIKATITHFDKFEYGERVLLQRIGYYYPIDL